MLIESMRDIGYSLETALADVIDNSITSKASDIQLFADTSGPEVRIGVLDNGHGMTEEDLLLAMRLGSRNPREQRELSDLGRFGLGLKIASFSQCRKLTVVTRRDGETSTAIWDLDYIAECDDWLVQVPDDATAVPWADQMGKNGTLVVWENLDRLVEPGAVAKGREHVVRRVNDATEHLELVFHRFLSGEPGLRKTAISLNGRALQPHDPFQSNHPATIVGPVQHISVGDKVVVVQSFTLPHHRKVPPAEWERLAGRAGYVKNQGFYVYRAKRLIIHGTWFGLARQTELTKLARVRIDMPNGLDAEWKIDVKKASAQPPYKVREGLRSIIETIGASSKRVYTARGRALVGDSRLPVWNRVQDKNEIVYRINPEHPVICDFVDHLPSDLATGFLRVMELVGSTLPMDALLADLGGEPEKVKGNAVSDETLSHTVRTTVRRLRASGVKPEDLSMMLQLTEPFRSNWPATERLLTQIASGEEPVVCEPG